MRELEQHVVAPRSRTSRNVLLEFLRVIEQDPGVSVERIVGESSSPRRLVIRAAPDTIKDLQARFGEHLIIELDSDLQLF